MSEISLLDEFLIFSNTVVNIPINQITIQQILYYDSEEFSQPEYINKQSFLIEKCLVESNDKYVQILLRNLSQAIKTNCGNDIDLETLTTNDFNYSCKPNFNEKSISKRYQNFKIEPENEILFKKIWLRHFLKYLVKIEHLIRLISDIEKPQNLEDTNHDKVKNNLHSDIFKGNTFTLWEAYKENKDMTASSRADLRVIYDLMMSDGYFQTTVELKHYISWLNKHFFDGRVIELKKQDLNKKTNIQRGKDYALYKTNLKITLK